MRFSIVLTVYGRTNLLSHALYCVQQQTYSDWELVVVFDGPNPAAKLVIDMINALKRSEDIRYLIIERTPGTHGNPARRQGLAAAQGDYVVWMGHDCLIDKDYLSTHIENIQKAPNWCCLSVVGQRYWSPAGWHWMVASSVRQSLLVENEPAPPLFWGLALPAVNSDLRCSAIDARKTQIDLLNWAAPRDAALLSAFLPEDDPVYEADFCAFDRLRKQLPIVESSKIVCGHF